MSGLRLRASWALFDWAQQPYFTLVGSFVFRPYFVTVLAATPAIGQAQIGYTGTIAGLVIALTGPLLGTILDRADLRALLFWCSIPFALACAGLWWAVPGDETNIFLVLACLTVAAIAAEITTTINNAMLAPIALTTGDMGRLSGNGVALGALGGVVASGLVIAFLLLPTEPLFGLDRATHETERFMGPFSSVWYVVFVAPLLLLYPSGTPATARQGPWREVVLLLKNVGSDKTMLRFMLGRMLVADATGALQMFGGIIAAITFGWTPLQLLLFGVFVLIWIGVGSVAGGYLDDRVNPKLTVLSATIMLTIGLIGWGSISKDHIFFVVAVQPLTPGTYLSSVSEQVFLVMAALVAVASGPLVSSMRAWVLKLAPRGEVGKWFGIYSVAGRATAFLAPLLISISTLATGDLRSSVVVILVFLFAGIFAFQMVPKGQDDS